jgi:hypothetical protein
MAALTALHTALVRLPGCGGVAPDDLEPLAAAGIAHDHVRVRGLRLGGYLALLRVPRLSQWDLGAETALAYERACFERAAPSGASPHLLGVLPVSDDLPNGALVVEEIEGAKPRLPEDMDRIAAALTRIHALPVPEPKARPPLQVHDDPVAATLAVIEGQARYLDEAQMRDAAKAMIGEELAWARGFAAETKGRAHPCRLVTTDAHPGNFLIEAGGEGRAVFVDLEKALYGTPAIDLAHASLYTSTMFDPEVAGALTQEEAAAFYETYLGRIEPALAAALKPWLLPMRRLTWLRTTTWCVRWQVRARGQSAWSQATLDERFRAHLGRIIPDYFDPERIAEIRHEWLEPGALAAALQ